MLKITTKHRKTNFLTPSGLRCLANFPTVNVSAGCAHNCVYCYTKGYSVYPGDGSIEVYENMAIRIASEIKQKRKKPAAVYFCPSCDPFQPIPQIQQITFDVMKTLLENGIGVQFVTKGKIPEEILGLFARYSSQIAGQIGLISVDDEILSVIEPAAAKARQRLNQLERLIEIGVKMSARCDPLIYGITDEDKQLHSLFSAIAKTGCEESAVSFLFLRPAITSSLKKNLGQTTALNKILSPFSEGISLPIGLKNSTGLALPLDIRKSSFERIKKIANDYDIRIHICGCKNRDITNKNCYITREQKIQDKLLPYPNSY
ncbi:MAG: radical SAM protein [Anaerohalosphaera sp.]|nr:radical SAM protein [Anaerohalosphaera sp.]